jgi:hypothetical protein
MILHLASFVYVHVRVFRFSVTVQSLEFRTAARHTTLERVETPRARSAQTHPHTPGHDVSRHVTTLRQRLRSPRAVSCVT